MEHVGSWKESMRDEEKACLSTEEQQLLRNKKSREVRYQNTPGKVVL